MERYTGVKLDAASPDAPKVTGVDEVKSMSDLPAILTALAGKDRSVPPHLEPDRRLRNRSLWSIGLAVTLGIAEAPEFQDVRKPRRVARGQRPRRS